jgi:hypothetical protein
MPRNSGFIGRVFGEGLCIAGVAPLANILRSISNASCDFCFGAARPTWFSRIGCECDHDRQFWSDTSLAPVWPIRGINGLSSVFRASAQEGMAAEK